MKTATMIIGVLVAALSGAVTMGAAQHGTAVKWTGRAVTGETVAVPADKQVSVVLFAMAGQQRSEDACRQLTEIARRAGSARVTMVVSGTGAAEGAQKIVAQRQSPWPVVADADYAASGAFGVRVWPTTVVVNPSGVVVGSTAGFPKNYRIEVEAYLAFAYGEIDEAELGRRLSGTTAIVDDPEQMAARHVTVAQRVLAKGMAEQALKELTAARALNPKSPQTRLQIARLLVVCGKASDAEMVLGTVDADAVSPANLGVVRGEILNAQQKWGEAAAVLAQAVKLNPQPAEAWYALGRAYDHLKQPDKAAAAYRSAFEATELGKELKGF